MSCGLARWASGQPMQLYHLGQISQEDGHAGCPDPRSARSCAERISLSRARPGLHGASQPRSGFLEALLLVAGSLGRESREVSAMSCLGSCKGKPQGMVHNPAHSLLRNQRDWMSGASQQCQLTSEIQQLDQSVCTQASLSGCPKNMLRMFSFPNFRTPTPLSEPKLFQRICSS